MCLCWRLVDLITKEATNKKSHWKTLFTGLIPLFILAHFGHHLLTALPVPMLPMIRDDFHLDYTQAGVVLAVFSLAYGIGQVPAGWLADRIGTRIMITISICGVAAAGFMVGLSSAYLALLIFMALMGVMGGGYHPAAPPIIAASVDDKKRGQALGFHAIGGSASYFISPIIAAALATRWGWRGAFWGLSISAIAFGVFFFLRLGKVSSQQSASRTANVNQASTATGRIRRLVLFVILVSFTQAVITAVISFIPLLMVDRLGFAKEAAAAFIAVYYFSGLWASPLGGHFSDRVGSLPLIQAGCFLAVLLIFLLNHAVHPLALGALLALLGMVSYVRMPVAESYIFSQTSARNRSSMLGIYYFSVQEGSGVLTPVLGYLIDRLGFQTTFTTGAVAVFIVALVCSILLWRSRD